MRWLKALAFILLSIVLISSTSSGNWQNIGGDLQHSGYSDSQPVELELVWKYKTGNSDISAPIIDSGILFVGSDDSKLYAIDALTGKLKWSYSAYGRVYTPTAKDGMVFAQSYDNRVYALDYNGNFKWSYNAGSSIFSPPVVYNNMLYGGFDRYIYSIYLINGSLKWIFVTGGIIESTPAISQGTVYAGSNDNKIYALDAGNKNLKWNFSTGGSVSSSPAVVNGVVYFGSKDNNIYGIDSSSGKLKWSRKTNEWVQSSAAVYENSVYIGSNDNNIYALNYENGDIIWKFKTNSAVDSPIIVIKGIVYAGSKDGTIYAVDQAAGTLIKKYSLSSRIISLALSDNHLYASSSDGYVYAFGAAGTETPVFTPGIPEDKNPPELRIKPIPLNVTSDKLTISGTALDPGGILVVTVNGFNAGTNEWSAELTLSEGENIITIVAVDKFGNVRTERKTVIFNKLKAKAEETEVSTPGLEFIYGIIGLIAAIGIVKCIKNKINYNK